MTVSAHRHDASERSGQAAADKTTTQAVMLHNTRGKRNVFVSIMLWTKVLRGAWNFIRHMWNRTARTRRCSRKRGKWSSAKLRWFTIETRFPGKICMTGPIALLPSAPRGVEGIFWPPVTWSLTYVLKKNWTRWSKQKIISTTKKRSGGLKCCVGRGWGTNASRSTTVLNTTCTYCGFWGRIKLKLCNFVSTEKIIWNLRWGGEGNDNASCPESWRVREEVVSTGQRLIFDRTKEIWAGRY